MALGHHFPSALRREHDAPAAKREHLPANAWARRQGLDRASLALGVALAFVGGTLMAGTVVAGNLAGGDSGQWVMLARAYQGEPVPAYRDPFAVPPAAPLLVLGLLTAFGDPFVAANAALVFAYALLTVAAFLLGCYLFGWAPGIVAALVVAAGQRFYLHLLAFGALPQLLSLAMVAFALAALVRFARAPSRGSQAWVALAAAGVLATHLPTAVLLLPIFALLLLLLPAPLRLAWNPLVSARAILGRTWPIVPAAVVGVALVWSKRSVYADYVKNEAAFYTKGLGFTAHQLFSMHATALTILVAGLLLGYLLYRALAPGLADPGRSASPSPGVREGGWTRRASARREAVLAATVLAVPVLALGVIVLGFHLAKVGTDYPRILPLASLPILISVGVVVPRLAPRQLLRRARLPEVKAMAMAVFFLVPSTAAVVQYESIQVKFYSVDSIDDLRDVLAEVEEVVPLDQALWTPVREGKWSEGVTGRTSLFGLPAWAIHRPWEWERKTAADTLLSGSTWVSTGTVAAMLQGNSSVTPENPVVYGYYKGDMTPLLRFDDNASNFQLRGLPPVSLGNLTERSERVDQTEQGVVVEQRAWAEIPQDQAPTVVLEVVRTVHLQASSDRVRVGFQASVQGATLDRVELVMRALDGRTWRVEPSQAGLTLYPNWLAEAPRLDVAAASLDGIDFRAPGSVLHGRAFHLQAQLTPVDVADASVAADFDFAFTPVGDPTRDLVVQTAQGALHEYGVGWALAPQANKRMNAAALAHGFEPVYENKSYILYRLARPVLA